MDPRAKSQIKCQRSKDINGMIPQVKKNIKGTIPRINKDIKVLRDKPKIKKYQSGDEPKSQDQMSPRVKKDIKSIKRQTQNKKISK